MAAITANISRDIYDERLRYVKNRLQQAVPYSDADRNDYMDSVIDQIRRVAQLLGEGSPNDGFKIEGASLSNDFNMLGGGMTAESAGRYYKAGYTCVVDRDTTYLGLPQNPNGDAVKEAQNSLFPIWSGEAAYDSISDHSFLYDDSANYKTDELVGRDLDPDAWNPGAAFPIVANNQIQIIVQGDVTSMAPLKWRPYRIRLSTPSGARDDYIFLNVFLDEIVPEPTLNSFLMHDVEGNIVEAERRWKLRHHLFIREGDAEDLEDYLDLQGRKHFIAKLALMERESGNPLITPAMVTDLRTKLTTLSLRYIRRFNLNVSSNGQTIFTLPETPNYPQLVFLRIWGVEQEYGSTKDYYVSGSNLVWTNRHFQLEIGDVLEVNFLQ